MNIDLKLQQFEKSLEDLRSAIEALKMRLVDMDRKIHKLKERE
jgi:hypothetical protein